VKSSFFHIHIILHYYLMSAKKPYMFFCYALNLHNEHIAYTFGSKRKKIDAEG